MILALVVSSICSLLESTLLSTPLSFINTLEQQGAKGVERLKRLKTDIDRPISAILVVNTIANTVGASLVGSEAARLYDSTGVGVVSGVFTFCILVFSEIIPKTIGSTYWRRLAIPASNIIQGLIYVTFPFVWILERLTRRISDSSDQVSVSREDVVAMVTTGAEEGVLEKEENKMIQNLLKLDEIKAHDIMTPSSVVTMAESSQTIRDFYNSDDFAKFSRIPLYEEENDDYVTGYVLKQEILEKLAEDRFNVKLKDLERPILSFQEDESVSTIWEKLLEKKEHICVIIDEYGSMRGIVTLEDVIETMLGFEIVDESDEVVDMQQLAKEQWEEMQSRQKQVKN
ncbi:MAG: HlyC/CorC family transporter [Bacteroidaceae bacterium]|nr:HlyC/CorC family transporter [Bacteroidaceae bacterium]MBR3443142.1 HlyC/CorC family transporter [Bacteroidaceae bacterium]